MKRLLSLLGVAATAVLLSWFKIVDYDVFFHVKTGQVILETGRLVRTNLFSSLFPDHPWHNAEWLFQVLVALAYQGGGWLGVQIFKAALVAALGVTLLVVLLGRGVRPLVAWAFAITSLAVMRFRFQDRPQLMSYLFFASVILIVDRARRRRPRALWILPPLFALWSNAHPELLVGLLYLCGVMAGEFLNKQGGGDDGRRNGLVFPLVAPTTACMGASLLNPEGRALALDPGLTVARARLKTLPR